MKSLHDYIAGRNQPYEFRIKLAKIEPRGDVMERIKHALDAYELDTVSAVKSLPIQEHREFPKWGPCECWQFDVSVNYPTTSVQIAQLIRERAGINPDWVCVYGKQQAEGNDAFEAYGKDHTGALLLDNELKDVPGAQDLVADKRNTSLLKELEKNSPKMVALESDPALTSTASKERTKPAQTTNQLSQGTTSPIGTRQNTIAATNKGK